MANLQLTLDDVRDAFDFLDSDMPWAEWSKIGRALYAEFGDNARDVFEDWSKVGSSYSAKAFNGQWKNLSKNQSTSFGSFIYMAKQAGWKPKHIERSEEEKQQFKRDMAERRAQAQLKRQQAEQQQWQDIKDNDQAEFFGMDQYTSGSQYFSEKNMENAGEYIDLRRGRDKFGKDFVAWAIWSELGNAGIFCGYERVLDKKISLHGQMLNKFSSDNAKTNVGFATMGWDRGPNLPKRIFVVGGFADMYAAHVCTGECVITPIGESNITRIIEILAKRHPEIEFIGAPDNDKTGRKIAAEASPFSSLPRVEGRDWNDVFIHEGREAVVEQLLDIYGFEEIESKTRYLTAAIRKGLNLLVSGMGTGKTTRVKEYIAANPDAKVLIISHRKELAKSHKSRKDGKDGKDDGFGILYYEDLKLPSGQGIDQNIFLKEAQRLVISIDSLWRLEGSTWDIVFFDEIEQGIGHFFAETNRHAEASYNMLRFLLTHSTTQIFADAHLGQLTKDFCREIGLNNGVLFNNTYKMGKDENGVSKKIYLYESKPHLTETLLQQLMNGQTRYVYANSKAEIKALAAALTHETERGNYAGKSLVVHADAKNEEVTAALEDIGAVCPELDVILASPTLGTGFNIERFNPEKQTGHKFEATVGFLNSRVGTSEEGHQGLQRAREVNEFHVWIDPAERSEPIDADHIQQKLVDEVSYETMKVLNIDPNTGKAITRNPSFEWLFARVKAEHNKSANNYRARWIQLALEDGYEIIDVCKNELQSTLGQIARQDAKGRNDRCELREIEKAPVLVGDEYDDMMNNGECHTSIEIAKSKVFKDLNLESATPSELDMLFPLAANVYEEFAEPGTNYLINPDDDAPIKRPADIEQAVTNALTFEQTTSRFVNKIVKLSLVNLTKSTANKQDANNIKFAQSLIGWRHQSIKQRHLIRMLSMAGIDADLNYNGKAWYKDDVVHELAAWLRKPQTQESLFKYSGITVSENTLSDPLQWLHNYLRSHGVPVESLGQKRIKSKQVHRYGINAEKWDAVRTLVQLRNRGIEAHIAELDTNLNEPASAAQSVTPQPSVINNQMGQGVTAFIPPNPSDTANYNNTEGERKAPGLPLNSQPDQEPAASNKTYALVEKLVSLAVEAVKLPEGNVRALIKAEGERDWESSLAAPGTSLEVWCLTIRDIFLHNHRHELPTDEAARLSAFSF